MSDDLVARLRSERLTIVFGLTDPLCVEAADQIERLRGVAKAYYKLTHEYSLACQEVRSLRARIRDNRDAADRIGALLMAVDASGSHDSGKTPQAAGGASDARQMTVPTDGELIAMQDRGELPSDEELAAEDRRLCGEDTPE